DPGPSPGYLYFTNYNGPDIGRVSVDSGAASVFAHVPVADLTRYGHILVHGDFVYWAMQKEDLGADPGKDIWRAKRQSAAAPTVTAELAIADDRPLGLAADDSYLYFGNTAKGTIERVAWADLAEGAPLPAKSEVLVARAI